MTFNDIIINVTIRRISMTSMSVSLPDQMRTFIKSRVQSGDYHNESEYIRDLIRKDKERINQEANLLDSLRSAALSGTSSRQIPEIIQDVEERLRTDGQL